MFLFYASPDDYSEGYYFARPVETLVCDGLASWIAEDKLLDTEQKECEEEPLKILYKKY